MSITNINYCNCGTMQCSGETIEGVTCGRNFDIIEILRRSEVKAVLDRSHKQGAPSFRLNEQKLLTKLYGIKIEDNPKIQHSN